MRRLSLLLFVCAAGAAPSFAVERWVEEVFLRHHRGNARIPCQWDPQKGLRLRVRTEEGKQELSIRIRENSSRIRLTRDGKTSILPDSRFFEENLPPLAARDTVAVLKLRDHGWWLYLRNQPIARFPVPFSVPGVVLQPNTQFANGSTGKARFQKVAPLAFNADFMIDVNTKDPLKNWEKSGGSWGLHTALETALEQESPGRLKKQPLQPDRSPNFYSLRGSGTGLYVTGYGFEDNYRLQASMRTGKGEVGLCFYYQDAQNYYAFVLESMASDATRAVCRLERRSSTRIPRIKVLGRCSIPATTHQWVMPQIRAYADQIDCYIDDSPVLSVQEDLPPSGRFGLYVNSDEPRRFDDVAVRSIAGLYLPNVREIRFHTLAASENFFAEPSFWDFLRGKTTNPPLATALRPNSADTEKWLALGAAIDPPHIFEVAVTPDELPVTAGLLVGFHSLDKPYFRYRYTVDQEYEHFRLEEVKAGRVSLLQHVKRRNLYPDQGRLVRLRTDGTEESMLKCYRNDEMVLLHAATTDRLKGASGLYAGPGSRFRFHDFNYRFEPEQVYRNQFEKNRFFLSDPYMRHWASPEGEWVKDAGAGRRWHKSDFFGRYNLNLPLVANSEVHLGVEENQSQGTVILRVKMLSDTNTFRLELYDGSKAEKLLADGEIPAAHAAARTVREGKEPGYTVYYEGYWVWARSGGTLVFQHRLPRPFAGSRVRVAGLNVEQLGQTFSHRYQTKDFLFREAQHHWVTNGGNWSVVNRFQCQPKWSHLNGESADSIAAMWSKYQFSGDFCVELYAGIRHGWYKRLGDLNITIMNQTTSPSSGYTLTCTGWDFNESQLLTKLYRNGKVVASTDKYAVPRRREGNRRKWHNPLLPDGRPVHGAWYYLKLRRIGRKLEFYFDNHLLLTWEDPDPIDLGSLGIWTYRNSMVVARVKVTADDIQPRRTRSRRLPAKPLPTTEPSAAERLERHQVAYVGKLPLELMHPTFWAAEDEVSRTRLSWHEELQRSPYLVATNVLGSGSMYTAAKLPSLPVRDVAGFRFLVKRTDNAQFNFHFTLGRVSGNDFTPEKRYFVQLAGTDFTRGPWQRVGRQPIQGLPLRSDWHRHGDWQEVIVWIPTADFSASLDNAALHVKVDGFGNLQPSYVQQGLTGNAPDEAYAIRAFSLIYTDLPKLQVPDPKDQRWRRFLLLDAERQNALRVNYRQTKLRDGEKYSSYFLDGVQTAMANYNRAGLNHLRLRTVPKNGGITESELLWLRPSAKEPDITIDWAPDKIDAVLFQSSSRDRRLATVKAFAGDIPLKLVEERPTERIAWLPAPLPVSDGKVPIRLVAGDELIETHLALADRPRPAPPRLMKLEGLTPELFNFADRQLPELVFGKNLQLQHGHPDRGSFLEVFNTEIGQRLPVVFNIDLPLAQYPLLQFRYRTEPSAQVSIYPAPAKIHFAEPQAKADVVPFSQPAVPDRDWHSWSGFIADATAQRPIRPGSMHSQRLDFRSITPVDQTGRYAWLELDDLCLGPAVHKAEQLRFVPHYEDADGKWTENVYFAIRPGPETWDSLTAEQRRSMKQGWVAISNGKPYTPKLADLPNGVHHLLLRAVDKQGRSSAVTDIPFLLDTRPPEGRLAMIAPGGHANNGVMLRARFANPLGAPLDSAALQFQFRGQAVNPSDPYSRHIRKSGKDILQLNWPAMLAPQIDRMKHGETGELRISNVRSGSGVPGEDLSVNIRIDHKNDRRPPAFLPLEYPENINYKQCWYGREDDRVYFQHSRHNPVVLRRKDGQAPYILTRSVEKVGAIALNTSWNVKTHPWLALQLRRPRPDESNKIFLRLTGSQRFVIPLTGDRRNKDYLQPSQYPVNWRDKKWTPVMIDVGSQLAEHMATTGKDEVITAIQIYRVSQKEKQVLHIRDITILAPWTAEDEVRIPVYDAHGVAGIDWEYHVNGKILKRGSSPNRNIVPTKLGLPPRPNAWLRCIGRDYAGNQTPPVWLPIPPGG